MIVMLDHKNICVIQFSDHTITVDVEKINREKMEQDSNLWDALEGSKWMASDQIEMSA